VNGAPPGGSDRIVPTGWVKCVNPVPRIVPTGWVKCVNPVPLTDAEGAEGVVDARGGSLRRAVCRACFWFISRSLLLSVGRAFGEDERSACERGRLLMKQASRVDDDRLAGHGLCATHSDHHVGAIVLVGCLLQERS
jgi:hypothetical protein